MKRFLTYLFIILMFGSIISFAISSNSAPVQNGISIEKTIAATIIIPGIAYADSSGDGGTHPPPPIPPGPK